MTTTELISKLERATGPSRELDAEIEALVSGDAPDPLQPGWCKCADGSEYIANDYTGSLDAALTLMPEGISTYPTWSCYEGGVFGAHCKLYGPSHKYASDLICHSEAHIKPAKSESLQDAIRLYALALCIASLRAREE